MGVVSTFHISRVITAVKRVSEEGRIDISSDAMGLRMPLFET